MASQDFSHFVYLKSKGSANQFYVVSTTAATYTVTDTPDANTSDNTTILGDISNDHFSVHNTTSYRNSDISQIYVGEPTGGQGVVGKTASKAGGYLYILYSNNSYANGANITVTQTPYALCFGGGTRIRTDRGDVSVEDLRIGDLAITSVGTKRPVVWIGSRRCDGGGELLGRDLWPVRVRAGAFGPAVPSRDLFLSPGHPVLVGANEDGSGGVLVPIMCLINGTTVARLQSETVTYWHVELDAHDILLAEGLAAESFLDAGSRTYFEGAADSSLHDPDLLELDFSARCRPVATEGPLVTAARARLETYFATELVMHSAWLGSGPSQQICN